MQGFRKHAEKGRHCVLLYCGDFDPFGLQISDFIRANLLDLTAAVGWEPTEEALTIERFGLNYDFIKRNGLTWVDGLETSSGRNLALPDHPDNKKPFVQEYLRRYGSRKVEANALVTRADAGRQLCREAIGKYLSTVGVRQYRQWLAARREEARAALPVAMRQTLADAEE